MRRQYGVGSGDKKGAPLQRLAGQGVTMRNQEDERDGEADGSERKKSLFFKRFFPDGTLIDVTSHGIRRYRLKNIPFKNSARLAARRFSAPNDVQMEN